MYKWLILLLAATSLQAAIVQEGVFIFDPQRIYLNQIQEFQELTIDHPQLEGYEVYGPRGLIAWAKMRGLSFRALTEAAGSSYLKDALADDPHYFSSKSYYDEYPTMADHEAKLQDLAARFPQILKLFSIGQSIEGRELWVMKISDNVEIDEVEPEFKYIANMHGNEITGREMMVRLIEELAESYMASDSRIRNLINSTELFIMPSMNPDGSEHHWRGNAIYSDLNRDFPDFIKDPINTYAGRQPETVAVMKFQAQRQFSLSANLHDGAQVVNYPWDSTFDLFPLEQLVIKLSENYASRVPSMANSGQFSGGITNGADWYVIHGGMQDWSYFWHNDLQLTLEISKQKWPPFYKIDSFYKEHKPSLINFMDAAHQGAGFSLSSPNMSGEVAIERLFPNKYELGTFSFHSSEFYKVLGAGLYRFMVTTEEGEQSSFLRIVSPFRLFNWPNYKRVDL